MAIRYSSTPAKSTGNVRQPDRSSRQLEHLDTAVEGSNILSDPGLWAHPDVQSLADHLERANSVYNLAFLIFAIVVLLAGLRELPADHL